MHTIMHVRQILLRNRRQLSAKAFCCFQSTSAPSTKISQNARLNRIITRLPRSLQPYTARLCNAPVSHTVAFLILHEITAIIPLVGLTGLFNFTGWVPTAIAEGKYMNEGVERFESYFKKKGWFGFGNESYSVDVAATNNAEQTHQISPEKGGAGTSGFLGAGKKQFLVEVAAAYAVTKVLLPARIIFSVWATPWFAKVFISRINNRFRKIRGTGKVQAVGGSVTMREAKGTAGHKTHKAP